MQVILLEELQNLGNLGDEVKVRAGYARNYLIPQGKAVIASEENRKKFETRRLELERLHAEALDAARTRASTLDGASVRIVRKAGEEGKLFGSVTTSDIVEAMMQAGLELKRSEIHLSAGPLKQVGDYEIAVSLHPEVHIKINVSVAAEEEEAQQEQEEQ
ncbi:MAG: 50S ribosomal protein L9 [Acidiferrobacterales bacterium]|nr:50S ribosomal protein L9 [Acidiferrobacterales bacterium]